MENNDWWWPDSSEDDNRWIYDDLPVQTPESLDPSIDHELPDSESTTPIPSETRGASTTACENYSYRVKIINPLKRSDFQTREIHNFKAKLESITELRVKLIEEFGESVPSTTDFQVGYFHGKQSAKHWLVTNDDLVLMYESIGSKKREVMLWCEARSKEMMPKGSKKKSVEATETRAPTKRKIIEDDISETVDELKEKHNSKYTIPQLRLWARMIASGNHSSLDDPPTIPALTGVAPKRRRESLSSVVAGVASSIASAICPDVGTSQSTSSATPTCTPGPLSPGEISDLRLKKLQELRELQQLLELGVLTPEEFAEQKAIVLEALRKLTE